MIRNFICSNGKCLAELKKEFSDKEYKDYFFFVKQINCPICGFGKMYEVKT